MKLNNLTERINQNEVKFDMVRLGKKERALR